MIEGVMEGQKEGEEMENKEFSRSLRCKADHIGAHGIYHVSNRIMSQVQL